MPFDKEGNWHGNPAKLAMQTINRHLYHHHWGVRGRGTLAERLKQHRKLHEQMLCYHDHEPIGEEEDLTQFAERLGKMVKEVSERQVLIDHLTLEHGLDRTWPGVGMLRAIHRRQHYPSHAQSHRHDMLNDVLNFSAEE